MPGFFSNPFVQGAATTFGGPLAGYLVNRLGGGASQLDPTWQGSQFRRDLAYLDPTRKTGGLFGEPAAPEAPQADPSKVDYEARLKAYIDELQGPLNLEDPRVQAILQNAQSATAREAQNRGIQGGLALSGQQAAYIGASANLMDAQRRLAGSLLDSAANREIRRDEMDYGRFLDEQSRNQDLWRTGGAVAGGLAGAGAGLLIPGAQPFLPALIAGGSQLGAGIGGGIGSMNQQPYQSSRSMYPTLNNLRI